MTVTARKANGKTPITDRGLKSATVGSPVAVGIDWITVTTKQDNQGFALYDIALNYWRNQVETQKDWNNKWYAGRTGGGLSWGSGKQGYVLMASGQAAPFVWKKSILAKGRVTRLDLQVTVECNPFQPDLPKLCYDHIVEMGYHKRRQYGLIQNTLGGVTLYAGSRNSAQYGRFYDKGIESKIAPAGKLMRYEIELKKPRSGSLADYLVTELQQGVYPERELMFYLYNWWLDRGVIPHFSPTKTDLIKTTSLHIETDTQRKLQWFRQQVAPSVAKVIAEIGPDEVLSALGLINLS